jgi:c-di-GMP-related signal transduction protein
LSNVSLDSLISKLNLSDAIKDGLQYRGQLGLILRLTDAMEKDCQEEISDSLTQLSLKSFVLKICVENAYTWAAYA